MDFTHAQRWLDNGETIGNNWASKSIIWKSLVTILIKRPRYTFNICKMQTANFIWSNIPNYALERSRTSTLYGTRVKFSRVYLFTTKACVECVTSASPCANPISQRNYLRKWCKWMRKREHYTSSLKQMYTCPSLPPWTEQDNLVLQGQSHFR